MRLYFRFLFLSALLAVSILILAGCQENDPDFTISGKIADSTGQGAAGVTVKLSGAASGTTTTNDQGRFAFRELSAGEYTVTPVADNLSFVPGEKTVMVNGFSGDQTVLFETSSANQPPLAMDDTVIAETTPVTITTAQLLANDSDPDNDILFISGIDQPARGVLLDNGDDTHTYTPGTDFAGQDSFTYTVSDGSGGTATAEVFLQVKPAASLSAEPIAVDKGQTATVSWTSRYAETCAIEPGIGDVPVNGSADVVIEKDTTFTLTATGPGGTATTSTEVIIKQPPRVSLSITPEVIQHGEAAVLSWEAATAETVYFNQAIGPVAPAGSMSIAPDYTTTYACTAVNKDLSSHQAVSVKVLGAPPPAAPPDRTFAKQYFDLVPDDASLTSYDPERFIVLTGQVRDADGNPLPEVIVEVFDHPEYGSTQTDAEGRFSLPAEGGTLIKVTYAKPGYLTAHRKAEAPVTDVVIFEPVTLLTRDAAATKVVFDGNPDTVMTHRSTRVNDEFGERACTLVFTGDNTAWELDQYGNRRRELSRFTVRATEYATPESMPAILPPTSAYTYCVELEADGVERLAFDTPITGYVDNFLGFEVGTIVPVGWYDRDRAVWVPSENGVVVRLLDTAGDGRVDALDADGDGLADDLDQDGDTSNEVTGLDATAYQPGDTCWRVQHKHFSILDYNWAYGLPANAEATNLDNFNIDIDRKNDEKNDCETPSGSHVNDRSRILEEDIPVTGTDLTLHYSSDRTYGYKTYFHLGVLASGDTVPADLKEIIVICSIAGQVLKKTLPPLPNQTADFEWDGLDYRGKRVGYAATAYIRIGFVYDAVYYGSSATSLYYERAFARPGEYITRIKSRKEMTCWRKEKIKVFPEKAKAKPSGGIASGWTISAYHCFGPEEPSILHKGDGGKLSNNIVDMITTVAGTEEAGYSGDNGPATEAWLKGPSDITLDRHGNLFIADTGNHVVRKVDSEGIITTVAGTGQGGNSGDGGPALAAELESPAAVAVDEDGNLFIADSYYNCVRKVDTCGIISTIAGTGEHIEEPDPMPTAILPGPRAPGPVEPPGNSGDGGPATKAELNRPSDLALDQEGNIYIADTGNHSIRKVDPDGFIYTVAGTGESGVWTFDGTGINTRLDSPEGIAIDTQGNLYIADTMNYLIRKVDPSGRITTVKKLNDYPRDVVIDAQGNIFTAASRYIRRIEPDGTVTTVAGAGNDGSAMDGCPAIKAKFQYLDGLELDSRGYLLTAENNRYTREYSRIRKIGPPPVYSGAVTAGDILYPDSAGLGYIIDNTNKHRKTIDLNTGRTIYTLEYELLDKKEFLTAIRDRFGNQTTINRYADGTPYSIVSPEGLVTQLSIDRRNHLTRITLPDGGGYDFTYTNAALLTSKEEPAASHTYNYEYDNIGRITDTYDGNDGHWQFARYTNNDGIIHHSVTTGENNLTTYEDQTLSTGQYTSIITGPAGGESFYTRSADGLSAEKNLSCGMTLNLTYDLDPEYKFRYIKETAEITPAGLTRTTSKDIDYEDTNYDEIPDIITRTVTLNDSRITTLENDVLNSQKTVISPEGRKLTRAYDPDTLVTTSTHIPGLEPTDYFYNSDGKLSSVVTGSRSASFGYDSSGWLASVTDPNDRTTSFTCDPTGRVTRIDRPDGTSLAFSYDANGNMTVLTNPSDVDHEFGYNPVDRPAWYAPPLSNSYSYVYDRDRRLIAKNFPSGRSIYMDYADPLDPADKSLLRQIQTPEGSIDFTYFCGSKVASISSGGESISYAYDGKLVTAETLAGTINQTLGYNYHSDFTVDSFTYAGVAASYTYDDDGLLTGSGRFAISRYNNPGVNETGLPQTVSDGTLHLDRAYTGYGETRAETTAVSGNNVYDWEVTARYPDGRIQTRAETVNEVTTTFSYTYDETGRLRAVTRDGTLVEEYAYDSRPFGTRTFQMNSRRGITGRALSYDDEDHLLAAGDTDFQYDEDGFLTSRTTAEGTTYYDYSSRGELLSVNLPDGTAIEYVHDPLGRRVAKKVNGVITEKYLWQGRTRLLAVYDGADNLLARFQYAGGRLPLAMEKEGVTYYLAYDPVGSLRAVADAAGNVVKEIQYDSFGYILSDTNPDLAVPFGFAGGLHDRDTGLVRFGHRDYDPDTGRWTAKDPILFDGGDTDLYGYCVNDPVNLVDPTGEFGIVGAAIGAASGAATGFISGLESGNIAAGVVGGLVGGAAGAAIGVFNPLAGGAAGGAIGNAISAWMQGKSGPCIAKDALLGSLHGFIGAAAATPIGVLGKMGMGAQAASKLGQTAASMSTTAISAPTSMISSHVSSSY